MRLYSFFAAAALASASLVAHADTIYSFVGTGSLAGNTFTIDSPDFLTYSSNAIPVSASTDFFAGGRDFGKITVAFFNTDTTAVATAGGLLAILGDSFPLSADGVFTNNTGSILTIVGSPAATPVAATPEPSSFALLGTGLLGVFGVARKRFA